MKELILGIDDAGRGPLIGSMFLAGVLMEKEKGISLKEQGVADSKTVVHAKRVRLASVIQQIALGCHIVSSTPDEIDAAVESGLNLNTLEAMKAAEIINKLNNQQDNITVVVDCPSVNTVAWRNKLLEFVAHPRNLNILCEHKADANYPSVSAASILAKCAREESIETLKRTLNIGDFGSGYVHDPLTVNFLKTHGKALENSGIFRKSWATWKNAFPNTQIQTTQASLADF